MGSYAHAVAGLYLVNEVVVENHVDRARELEKKRRKMGTWPKGARSGIS